MILPGLRAHRPPRRFVVRPGGVGAHPRFDWHGPVLGQARQPRDGSLGIDQDSVVTDARPADGPGRNGSGGGIPGGSVLIEAYLARPGEFNVGGLAMLALPAQGRCPSHRSPFRGRREAIVADPDPTRRSGTKARSKRTSPARSSAPRPGSRTGPLSESRLGELAVSAFQATTMLPLRPRSTSRLDDRGEPMILEVNAEPRPRPRRGLVACGSCCRNQSHLRDYRHRVAGGSAARRPLSFVGSAVRISAQTPSDQSRSAQQRPTKTSRFPVRRGRSK